MKKFLSSIFFSFLILFLTTCKENVGLGEQVDTEKPTLAITSPDENTTNALRRNITIAGTCDDDNGIMEIRLQFYNSDKKEEFPANDKYFLATVNSKGTEWEYTIDSYDEDNDAKFFPDGNYTATVTAVDKALRKTSQTKDFRIDNTPPVVVLSRPSSKKSDSSLDSFGQLLTLEGQAQDRSEISLVEIEVYSIGDDSTESAEPIHTIELKNVPLAINLDAAKWLDENYNKLYGNDLEAGNKNYAFKLRAYDGARSLPEVENEKGNCTEGYFLQADIYDVLTELKVTGIYSFFEEANYNVQEKSETSNTQIDELKEKLVSKGAFCLNPKNNPTYKLNGYSVISSENKLSEMKVQNGSKMTIEVSVGLDSTPLVEDSLGIYALECDENGNIAENAQKISIIKPAVYLDENRNEVSNDLTDEEKANRKIEISGSNRKITFELKSSDGLEIGKCYILRAEGYDENKNTPYCAEGEFGIFFASNGLSPKLSVSEPSSIVYLKKDGSFTVKGTATHVEGLPVVIINCGDKELFNQTVSSDGTFEKTISTKDFVNNKNENVSEIYSVSIKAVYSGIETVQPIEKSVYYDVDDPKILINSLTPVVETESNVETESKINVNGNITLKGNISDDFAGIEKNSLSYKTFDGEKEIAELSGTISTFPNFEINIDTSKITDKTNLDLRIYAKDKAQNGIEYKIAYDSQDSSEVGTNFYFVDQSTDIPEISSSNMNFDAVSENENLFGIEGRTIYVTATDDDGVASITGSIVKTVNGVETVIVEGVTKTPEKATTSFTIKFEIPETYSGSGKVVFAVKDINGVSDTKKIPFAVDMDFPAIQDEKIADKTYENNMFVPSKHLISVVAKDSNGISKVFVDGKNAVNVSGTDKWTFDNTIDVDGEKQIIVKAVDNYGRETQKTLNFIIDTVKPSFQKNTGTAEKPVLEDSSTVAKAGNKKWTHSELAQSVKYFNSNSITLEGNVYDKNGISGYILEISNTDESGNSATSTDEGTSGSVYSITSAKYSEGFNSTKLTIKDSAGNSIERSLNIYVDSEKPEISSVSVVDSTESTIVTNKDSLSIKVSAKDSTSGIQKILVGTSLLFKEENAVLTKEFSSPSKEITEELLLDLTKLSGANTIYVRTVDFAGLESADTEVVTIIIDKTPPKISYSSHVEGSTVNKKITLSGEVTDANLAANATFVLYGKESSSATWNEISVLDSEKIYSGGKWTISNIDTENLSSSDGNYYFQVRFTDIAGNTTGEDGTQIHLVIDQNSDRPLIKLNNINLDGQTRLNQNTVSGTVTDDDGEVSNFYVQIVKDTNTYSASNWIPVTVNGGAWSYEIPGDENKNADGKYTIYFKVTDKADSTFETKTDGSDGLYVPYIQDSSLKKDSKPVNFQVDTTAPEISLVDVSFDEGKTWRGTSIGNNSIFGGSSYTKAQFKVEAKDSVTSDENLTISIVLGEKTFALKWNSSDKAYFGEIDFSTFESGIYTIKVNASDEAKMTDSFQRSVIIDNSSPETIKNVVPKATEEVTGEFSLSGLIEDDENANSGIPASGALKYYIPKYSESTSVTTDDQMEALLWSTENLSQSSISWSIDFTTLATKLGYDKVTGNLDADYDSYADSSNPGVYKIPVWFRAVDNTGNVGYIKNGIFSGSTEKDGLIMKFNPNADKPSVGITYPSHDQDKNLIQYCILGGTIRFMGNASDNEGVDAVYLQFDMDGDGVFENGFNEDGSLIAGNPLKESDVVDIPVKGGKGILAKGTVSWSYSLDVSNLEGLTIDKNKLLHVRACAIDNDSTNGKLASSWSNVVNISINNQAPQIYVEKLRQYDGNDSIKEQDYAEDIYISGENWYLEGYFEDEDGIDIDSSSVKDSSGTAVDGNFTERADSTGATNGKRYGFKIPVSATSGSWKVILTVKDKDSGSPQTTVQTFALNIDNTAPAFQDGKDDTELVIFKGGYETGEKVSSTSYIQNSNGQTVTIASKVDEEGSGFERAVFYFTRTTSSDSKTKVFNVMESSGTDGQQNRTEIVSSKKEESVYLNSENLPVLSKTVTRNEENTLTFTDLESNKNIRKAGLVKIGGTYYKILLIENDVLTFDGSCSTSFTDAEFVYGMVSDNNDNGSGINEDGDGMAESYSKAGTKYIWDASVDSSNIPDGPVTLNVVVFDKAGNTNHGSVETRISNSPVRITSVKLATDLNGNGSYENTETYSEYQQFYAFKNADDSANTTKGTQIWNLATNEELYGEGSKKYWTVKSGLSVIPEFVGGTSPFYWAFSKNETDLTEAETLTASDANKIENNGTISLTNTQIDSSTLEGKTSVYSFSFWDSTEELIAGSNTSWTVLNAKVMQELTDSTAPIIQINPFYWNDSTDNSLYQNSKDKGHIELESDLTFTGSEFTQSSGVYDTDPKVSGIIKISGKANDNRLIKNIFVKIPGFTTNDDYAKIATFDATNSKWDDTKEDGIEAALTSNGYAFTITNEEFSQKNGHTVEWTLTWDTSKITGVATADVKVQVKASDSSGNLSDESTTQTTKVSPTACYQMDVVPYITGITTKLSDLEVNNPSVYARTALGKYPVYYYRKTTSSSTDAETIVVNGFNISGGTVTFTSDSTATGSLDSVNSLSLPEKAKSGEISIKVNGISNLNNKNNNDATGDYNKQPNEQNNNILNDNIELAIWEINSKAAVSESGELSEVVMHVNPSNGMLGFAFAHSQDLASYPNGTSSSYQTWITDWTGVNQVGFTFDQKGNMWGTNGGTDTATSYSKAGRFGLISSKWGVITESNQQNDKYTGYTKYRRLRLEYLGLVRDGKYTSNVNRFAKGDCSQFATTEDGTKTNLYMMYYDNTLGELKFKAGQYDTSWTYGSGQTVDLETFSEDYTATENWQKAGFSFGDFADDAHNEKADETTTNYDPTYSTTSIVSNVTSGANGNTSAKPGIYYSIGAVKGTTSASDVVVAVWYDETSKNLWYSYIKNPLLNAGKRDSNGKVSTEWAKPISILSNAGGSCEIKVDDDGHIHIAVYSRDNAGSLYYVYLDNYKSTYDKEKNLVKVDSYGSTGQYITMEIAKDASGNNIPYIGYWMNSMSCPKYTYLVDTASSTTDGTYYPKAGVDSKSMYTGAWESIILPTKSNIVVDDINIGLYRDSDGKIKAIPTQTESADTKNGVAGGNGTANPVLAYGISETGSGYIETAQLK